MNGFQAGFGRKRDFSRAVSRLQICRALGHSRSLLEQILERLPRVVRTLCRFAGGFFLKADTHGIKRAVVALVFG